MARILIADDSETQVYQLRKMLEVDGHEVLTAHDGTDAVAVAQAELPDLILMDVVMPQLNGFQATRQIAQNDSTKHIPIIMVTTKQEETDEIWGRRQGAKAYVTKPVDASNLRSLVKDFLRQS